MFPEDLEHLIRSFKGILENTENIDLGEPHEREPCEAGDKNYGGR